MPVDPSTSSWRRRAAAGVQALPPPLRRRVWDARRTVARTMRRRREASGDYSRSQPANHRMDVQLDELLGIHGGFFVEAGANDGFVQSNTYFLERARGWHGVLIEPAPLLARAAARERPASVVVQCALVASDFEADTIELRYGGSKTVVEHPVAAEWVADSQENMALDEPEHVFTVPARTLSDVLDEVGAPEVDLLSLDVEGYEPSVLRGLDLERHAPRYALVEVDMRSGRDEVEAVLGDRYRPLRELSPWDVLYERVDSARS
jgi:FkbM family methyltransferase